MENESAIRASPTIILGSIDLGCLTLREFGDRILFVQTFSKNWAITGWRMGWLQVPPELGQTIENLIQYNTLGVPTFLPPAGVAALNEGEAFGANRSQQRERAARLSAQRSSRTATSGLPGQQVPFI